MIKINPRTRDAYELLHDGILAFAKAERQGICVDVNYIQHKKQHLTKKIERLEQKFKDSKFYKHWQHVNKNPNFYSDKQLAHFLYDVKKIKPVKTTAKSEQGSVDNESLRKLNILELDILLQIKKVKKIYDVLDGFEREQVNGILHPFFNLNLVRTFRSSSDSPNFQNIPKRDDEMMKICRRAIIPRKNRQLVEIDYGQLEVRISACYNNDQKLIHDILHGDMHTDMAKEIFKINKIDKKIPGHNTLRQAAKNGFVFPQFYGDYYKNCAANICEWVKLPEKRWKEGMGIYLGENTDINGGITISDLLISNGIKSFDKFTEHIRNIEDNFWNKRYYAYQAWKERWWKGYREYGYIDMKTGFRCSGIMTFNDCINYPVQGAAFHCLLWSFIETDKLIREQNLDSRLIGQIHDSMILDVNPNELDYLIPKIKEITCKKLPKEWKWITVPLNVDIDVFDINDSWTK
jgi:DNA polymerase I